MAIIHSIWRPTPRLVPWSTRQHGSASQRPTPAGDRIEISLAARLRLNRNSVRKPKFRQSLVRRVRLEITDGTYETQEKIDIAAARLAGDCVLAKNETVSARNSY